MFRKIFLFIFILPFILYSQRIYVEDRKFKIEGKELWLNGVNTPWQHWNDFGGNFDPLFWDNEFSKIRKYGGNLTRIWITCNGEVGIKISSNGKIEGMTEKFWDDVDTLMSLAKKHKIYVLATLISFDHTKDSHPNYSLWRKMYLSDENISSFVSNYVIPFAKRYATNDYLFAIEPCNEIEWVHEEHKIPWERLQLFCARVASAVHSVSSVLVTVGCSVKWQSDKAEGNFFSDDKLQKVFLSKGSYIDFYSPHFYDWVIRWFGNPFYDKRDVDYNLDDKPAIIGECPANAQWVIYEKAYKNGWEGVCAWTSNGVDANGNIDGHLGEQMKNFAKKYQELVRSYSLNKKKK